jgi:ornithine cyclodeaminase/alanine dehydrogenase-like protein (mu-crystallin family)
MIARVTASRTEFLYLGQQDVVAAGGTDMPAMVDVLERAFRIKAAGQVRMPPKVTITWSDEPATEELHGRIMAMPGYVGGEVDVAGLKWIPSVPGNPARGLPRANAHGSAAVELADVVTGRHPGRGDAGERIVVSPVGVALDDLAAAAHVLEGARARGLGTSLRLRTGAPVWE